MLGLLAGGCVTVRGSAAGHTEPASQATSPPSAQALAARADAFVAPYVAMRDFSGTILIARGDRVVLSRGYGFADIDRRIVPDDRTKFGIGSVTKTMTAAAIERLAQQGRVTLADPIATYLPGFVNGDRITIAHLLEHSSGLRDYYTWPTYASGRASAVSKDEFLTQVQSQPLDFAPGTRSSYSNSGYFVLAAIIERVSGVSYAAFLERHIFRPLGMDDSGTLDDSRVIPGLAVGYDAGFPPARVQPAAPVSRSWLLGSGSTYASARDVFRWIRSVRNDAIVRGGAFTYRAGWGSRIRFGTNVLQQTGRTPNGYASHAALYARDDLSVIVLSNIQAEVTEQIGVGLAAIALGEAYELPGLRPGVVTPLASGPASFTDYPGRYEIAPGFVLTVRSTLQGLLLAGPDGAFLPVDHVGPDRFFFRTLYVPITFERDSTGRVTTLDWSGQFKAKRLEDPEPAPRTP